MAYKGAKKTGAFEGVINELENILIDNFSLVESNTCFFLSHCHTDHMANIENLFSVLTQKPEHYLYCSPISRLILLNKYNVIKRHGNDKFIKELTLPSKITVPGTKESSSYDVTVTPIPSGHCPGSIMFLFETFKNSILYTGDFRISKNDIHKINHLHKNNKVKSIDTIYFDATFFDKSYENFSLRTDSVNTIVDLCENWLKEGLNHKVLLLLSGNYNYEFAFIKIARKLNCKIHINRLSYNIFKNVPEIGFALTDDFRMSRISALTYNEQKRYNSDGENLRKIVLKAKSFVSQINSSDPKMFEKISENEFEVCFATHCSYTELCNFLNYLRPKKLVPFSCFDEELVNSYIEEMMSDWVTPRIEEKSSELSEVDFPLIKKQKYEIKFRNETEEYDSVFNFFLK